jgi:hypothetical protein
MNRREKSILTQTQAIRAEFAEGLTPRRKFSALGKRVLKRLDRIEAILGAEPRPPLPNEAFTLISPVDG